LCDRKGMSPQKSQCHLSPKVLLQNNQRKTRGGSANPPRFTQKMAVKIELPGNGCIQW